MEFGNFDDELFDDAKKVQKDAKLVSYNAKFCEKEYFESSLPADPAEAPVIWKARGDLAYLNKNYHRASLCYIKALECLPGHHNTVRKDICESLSRSYSESKHHEEAIKLALSLLSEAMNFEQKTSAVLLLAKVYRNAAKFRDELLALIHCIWAHPSNPVLWEQLADVYLNFKKCQRSHREDTVKCNGSHIDNDIGQRADLEAEVKSSCCHRWTKNASDKLVAGVELMSLETAPDRVMLAGDCQCCDDPVEGATVFQCCDNPVDGATVGAGWTCSTGLSHDAVAGWCFIRARKLRRNMLPGEASFVKVTNQKKIEELSERIRNLHLPPDVLPASYRVASSDEEDKMDAKDEIKISLDESSLIEFERKWFSSR